MIKGAVGGDVGELVPDSTMQRSMRKKSGGMVNTLQGLGLGLGVGLGLGMAMGTHMGPSYACLFLGYMDQSLFRCCTGTIPHLLLHYIDVEVPELYWVGR
eukprot:g38219.t1